MAVSDAQKKSAQKWDAANLDRMSLALPKGKKDVIKSAAAAVGESMNQYISGAIDLRLGGVSGGDSVPLLSPAALSAAKDGAEKAGETLPIFLERAVNDEILRDERKRKLDSQLLKK